MNKHPASKAEDEFKAIDQQLDRLHGFAVLAVLGSDV
jgi:hypothetical protein